MEKDKRYLVFSFDAYYPSGGLCDNIDSVDTIQEALDILKNQNTDFKQLYDRIEGKIIDLKNYGFE